MVTFNVHSKTHKVPAYIDSGNSFFNCIAKETYEKIGFNLSQLEESPTPAVSQAGGGATLKILGKVPNTKENGFAFESSKTFFPLKNIFVVEGLHHEFNISYAFLKENHCIVDIKNDYLIFEPPFFKKQKFPMVHPPSTKTILCGALLPNLPPRGRTLRPRESIILPLPASDHGHFFYPRRCTAGGGTATFTEGFLGNSQCRGRPQTSSTFASQIPPLPIEPCILHLKSVQFAQPYPLSKIAQSHQLTLPFRKIKGQKSMTKLNWTRNTKN